jgi:hypothetical protein
MKKFLILCALFCSTAVMAQLIPFDDGCGSCYMPTYSDVSLRCNDGISGSNGDCFSSMEFRIALAEDNHDRRCWELFGADDCVLEGDVEWNTIGIQPDFDLFPYGGYMSYSQAYRTWSTIGNQAGGVATSGVRTKTCAFAGTGESYCSYNGGG